MLDSALVTRKDIEAAEETAEEKGTTFGDILVREGKLSEGDYRRMQAYVLGIPFVDLKGQKLDFNILSIIPEPLARSHNIVAYKKTATDLEGAMLDPEDLEAIDFIKKKSELRILPRLTDSDSIKQALLQYQKSLKAEFGDLIQKEAISLKAIAEEAGEITSDEDLAKLAEDLPVVRIVDTLLNHAVLQNASDIHIEPEENELMVRYRIDGILHDAMVLPKSAHAGITARIKVLANLRLDEKRLPQDGRFKIETGGQRISLRVSTLPTFFGEKTAMRLLPEESKGFTLENLGFHGAQLEHLQKAIRKTVGLLLATGPTGSGKTTTLYTILEILNKPEVNISTIEDPIEYQIGRINQTQVKPDIGLTFGTGLRTLVRQDPDILMVGEIRDSETVQLAINAALTGHLVLSTVHTNSAAGTIPRLIDMGAEPFLIVSTLDIVVSQRLVRRLAKIREKYVLSKAEFSRLEEYADMARVLAVLKEEKLVKATDEWKDISFCRPKASDESPDGYIGRAGIREVMPMSKTIGDMVLRGATSADIEAEARKEGMLTMIEDGIYKAAIGITSLEEVFRVANS